MNLSFLFASFGHQLHQVTHLIVSISLHLSPFQVFISYGLLFGLGAATVRDSSSMMVRGTQLINQQIIILLLYIISTLINHKVGQYFKMRRDVAEMWSSAGVGIGILAFSLLYCQAIG